MSSNQELIKKCLRNDFTVSDKTIPNVSNVYQIETENELLYFWNSSNNKIIHTREVLPMIAEQLLTDDSGSVTDPMTWAEIMWEIEEKF
jgi:hypothetical protein